MLAAGGTRLMSLFGPTNPKRHAPFCENGQVVLSATEYGGQDMSLIPIDAVVERLVGLMAA